MENIKVRCIKSTLSFEKGREYDAVKNDEVILIGSSQIKNQSDDEWFSQHFAIITDNHAYELLFSEKISLEKRIESINSIIAERNEELIFLNEELEIGMSKLNSIQEAMDKVKEG